MSLSGWRREARGERGSAQCPVPARVPAWAPARPQVLLWPEWSRLSGGLGGEAREAAAAARLPFPAPRPYPVGALRRHGGGFASARCALKLLTCLKRRKRRSCKARGPSGSAGGAAGVEGRRERQSLT